MPCGADKSVIKNSSKATYPFTLPLADEICGLYMQGNSVRVISEKVKIPAHIIYHWMNLRPDFKKRMMEARELRGFYYEEKAVAAAEEADEENVQSQKLKSQTYQWAAEVNNRSVFGKSTKLTGDPNAPLSFVVDTGIYREPIEVSSNASDAIDITQGDAEEVPGDGS